MPSAALAPRTSSKYGRCHPPCRNPPSVSSSGDPGACITPSRDKNSITRSILIGPQSPSARPAPRLADQQPAARRASGTGLLDTLAADVVGDVYGLVGTGVRAPAAREGAVLTPGAGEGCVERSVRHRDGRGVALNVPLVRQRGGREIGVHRRWKGVGLGVVADQLQAVDLQPHEVDPHALLEKETARQPPECRLAGDVLLVGADQVPSMVQVPTRRSRRLSAGSGSGALGFSDMTFLLCWVQPTFCHATS